MAPSTAQLTTQLRQIIWYHLDNESHENALFFAGRLHAIDPRNPDSVHILALCHLRCGQAKAAYDQCRPLALKREHLGCSYVFAQSCLVLEAFADGIAALERVRSLWEAKSSSGTYNSSLAETFQSEADACMPQARQMTGHGDAPPTLQLSNASSANYVTQAATSRRLRSAIRWP